MPAMPSTDFSQLSTLCASFGCHPGGLCNVKESMTDPSTSVTTCNKQQHHLITIQTISVCRHSHSLNAHSLHLDFNCTVLSEFVYCCSMQSDSAKCQVTASGSTTACSTEHILNLTPCFWSWQASLRGDDNLSVLVLSQGSFCYTQHIST